jgi:signal peptidase I
MMETTEGKGALRNLLEWIVVIIAALAAAILVRAFVVEPYEIPTESMTNTIQVGDRILGEKVSYRFSDPEAGDIVTFIDPEDSSTTLIKRIIATPGQTVEVKDGAVYVDGEKLDEPYTLNRPSEVIERYASNLDGPVTYPYTLGEDEYWVMGDNRTNSLDSRYFGPITRDSITSKAMFIFWPLNDSGTL